MTYHEQQKLERLAETLAPEEATSEQEGVRHEQ